MIAEYTFNVTIFIALISELAQGRLRKGLPQDRHLPLGKLAHQDPGYRMHTEHNLRKLSC